MHTRLQRVAIRIYSFITPFHRIIERFTIRNADNALQQHLGYYTPSIRGLFPVHQQYVHPRTSLPKDYVSIDKKFLVTIRRCRELAEGIGHPLQVVQASLHERSSYTGIRVPFFIVTQICRDRERSFLAQIAARNRADRLLEARVRIQLNISYPAIPAPITANIVRNLVTDRRGDLSRAEHMDVWESVQLAVVAQARHGCTDYDALWDIGLSISQARLYTRAISDYKIIEWQGETWSGQAEQGDRGNPTGGTIDWQALIPIIEKERQFKVPYLPRTITSTSSKDKKQWMEFGLTKMITPIVSEEISPEMMIRRAKKRLMKATRQRMKRRAEKIALAKARTGNLVRTNTAIVNTNMSNAPNHKADTDGRAFEDDHRKPDETASESSYFPWLHPAQNRLIDSSSSPHKTSDSGKQPNLEMPSSSAQSIGLTVGLLETDLVAVNPAKTSAEQETKLVETKSGEATKFRGTSPTETQRAEVKSERISSSSSNLVQYDSNFNEERDCAETALMANEDGSVQYRSVDLTNSSWESSNQETTQIVATTYSFPSGRVTRLPLAGVLNRSTWRKSMRRDLKRIKLRSVIDSPKMIPGDTNSKDTNLTDTMLVKMISTEIATGEVKSEETKLTKTDPTKTTSGEIILGDPNSAGTNPISTFRPSPVRHVPSGDPTPVFRTIPSTLVRTYP